MLRRAQGRREEQHRLGEEPTLQILEAVGAACPVQGSQGWVGSLAWTPGKMAEAQHNREAAPSLVLLPLPD